MFQNLREIFRYFGRKRKLWLIPLVVCLLFIGFLAVVTSSDVVAPLIYTLF